MQEGNDDINRVVYIPFSTMRDLKDTHYLDTICFNYNTPGYEKLEPAVRTILATQHKFSQTDHQAVRVFNLMMQVHQFEIITLGLKILMGFIGTLTLGIGGIGLMNIMLVSVTQRTREIGTQKALGAQRRYILMQFLAEALTITFIGGVLGVILAYGVAFSVGRLTLYSAFAKTAEAGDIRLVIAPGTLSRPPSFSARWGWSAAWYQLCVPRGWILSRPCVTNSGGPGQHVPNKDRTPTKTRYHKSSTRSIAQNP
jgi:putative ABC transport system permease protein